MYKTLFSTRIGPKGEVLFDISTTIEKVGPEVFSMLIEDLLRQVCDQCKWDLQARISISSKTEH